MSAKTKSEWPKVVKCGNSSVTVYQRKSNGVVSGYRIFYTDVDGQSKNISCSDEVEAMATARKKAELLSTFGAAVASVPPETIAAFVVAGNALQPFGVTITTACQSLTRWLVAHGSLDGIDRALAAFVAGGGRSANVIAKSVKAAAEELIASKENSKKKKSVYYISDLNCKLRPFWTDFNCDVSSVTTTGIQTWLNGKKISATTYMNIRRILHLFFEYCVAQGYCLENPVVKVETHEANTVTTEIYSPAQMRDLLAGAPRELVPMLAICGFGGVRTAEFERMTWKHVMFENKAIVLDRDVTKTGSRRVIPMADNLQAWLADFKADALKNPTAKIWLNGRLRVAREATVKKSGVTWKQNALRHSFCSYRLACCGDKARTALEAGNSPKMIDEHYNALVTESAAKDWFNIFPK